MAYEEMKCRKCGKPIQFAEGAPWIRCVYCGAEYTRTAKKKKQEKCSRSETEEIRCLKRFFRRAGRTASSKTDRFLPCPGLLRNCIYHRAVCR